MTFSDMVTLLLTFFVMLLTLSDVQDPELFDKGRDSFLESLRYMGLGVLFGKTEMAHLGELKTRHPIPHPDEFADRRTIDAKAEELRRILKKLEELTTVTYSPVVARTTNFSITNIHFSPGRVDLNEAAEEFLSEFCMALQQDTQQKQVKLYVLGLASEEKTEKAQWLLSAERAQVVADFLRDRLSPPAVLDSQKQLSRYTGQPKWLIYSWGAGPGGEWVNRQSPISRESQILIAVLRESD